MAALHDDGTVTGVVCARYGAVHLDVVEAVLTILAILAIDGDVEALDARARLVLTIVRTG